MKVEKILTMIEADAIRSARGQSLGYRLPWATDDTTVHLCIASDDDVVGIKPGETCPLCKVTFV
jgi:hypothetical protein